MSSESVYIFTKKFVTTQHPEKNEQNMNGELAHRADFAHFFQVAKARSDSDHRQRGMQRIPSLGC